MSFQAASPPQQCPYCGHALRPTAKFCAKCGANLKQDATPHPPAQPDPAPTPPTHKSPQLYQPPDSYQPPKTAVSPDSQLEQPPKPYNPYPPQQSGPSYPSRPLKDRSLAIILEILPGLFGFLGFGWIYSGNTSTGAIILIGFLFWSFLTGFIAVLTVGFSLLCTLPLSLLAIILSSVSLNNYTKNQPDLFGP